MITTKRLAITHELAVFGLVWFGQLVSLVGSGLSGFALGVWYYQNQGSVTQLALFSFFNVVPGVLLSPVAGVFVDRWDRRRAMLLSDVGAGVCSLTTWLLLTAGQAGAWPLQPWHLYLPVGASSAFSAFRWPAYYAVTSLLVPKQHLSRASGAIELGAAIAQVLAPAMAGVLVVSVGLQGVILTDLATFVFAVTTLLAVRFPQVQATPTGQAGKGSVRGEAALGWTYIQARPGLLGLLVFAAIINLTMGFVMVLIIPLVLSFTGAATLGAILSIGGAGMVVGGIVISAWGGPRRRIHGVLGFTLLAGLVLLLGGLRPNVPLVAGAAFVFLFSFPIVNGCSQAIWQTKVAPDVQGRVFAVRRMIVLSSTPLTRLAVGPLADQLFEPWLAPNGLLAGSVGQVIGVGPGRGIGFLFIILGLVNVLATCLAALSPRLRQVEDELPDAIGDRASSLAVSTSSQRKDKSMKRIRTWLVRIGIGLLVIVVALAGLGAWWVRRPWPQVNGNFAVAGLSAPVKVIRDKWGVPHIYAENEHDLFFAQGYVHAQDRMWQMDVNRRTASGTLSSLLGKSAISTDVFRRLFGLRRVAEQSWATMDADSRAILEAYAEGVNAYLQTHRDRLPLEYTIVGAEPDPWTPVDTLASGNQLCLFLGGNFSYELIRMVMINALGEEVTRQLFPPNAKDTPIIVPDMASYNGLRSIQLDRIAAQDAWRDDPEVVSGSNTWVVHGSRSATGQPFLANDTHLGLQMPAMWYENGLHGGRFDVVGFTFAGVPLVIIGHNQKIAWGSASLGSDVQDFYIEKVDDPKNPTRYEFEGKWRDMQIVTETIPVKGGQPYTFTIRFTHHGPIINDLLTQDEAAAGMLALDWDIYHGNALFTALRLLNLAQNWNEFQAAMHYWDSPSLNIAYADVEGNVGYQATGKIPVRVPGHNGLLPVPGWTGEYEWKGFLPFEKMPFSLNPPTGVIATANNKVTPDSYPYVLSYDWFPGYRARRILDLLAASPRLTLEDMQKIQADTYSLPAERLRPYLLALQPQNDLEAQVLEQVKAWDLRFEADRVGASIYETWYAFLLENTISDELGEARSLEYRAGTYGRHGSQHVPMMVEWMADPDNAWFDDVTTAQKETRDDIARRSLTDAIAWLSERYGKDPKGWAWGRMHTITFAHPLSRGLGPLKIFFDSPTIAARGENFTINEASFRWTVPYAANHSVSMRMIVDMSDLDKSLSTLTLGQSGHVFHPQHLDQFSMWQNVQYHPMLFTRPAVEANRAAVLDMAPAAR